MRAQFLMAPLLFLSKASWKIGQLLTGLANKIDHAEAQRRLVISSTKYDMVKTDDELYYAAQYWAVIEPHLMAIPENASIVDLGCSQGRFSLRLGRRFPQGSIIGCDISSAAIAQAKAYAGQEGIENIQFKEQDIAACLCELEKSSMDLIFMTEVAFFYPDWKNELPNIVEALKPGGIFVASFRSQYFYALILARERNLSMVDMLLERREGKVFGSTTTFTWQTTREIRALLERNGLNVIEQRGIGACSGIPGDPNASICRPSLLREDDQEKMMRLELELGGSVPDTGRYILVIAKKPLAV